MRLLPHDLPIRRKMLLIGMGTTIFALLLVGLVVVVGAALDFHRSLGEELRTQAKMIAIHTTASLEFNDPGAARETLAALSAADNIVCAAVYTADGKIFSTYTRDPASGAAPPPSPQEDSVQLGMNYLSVFQKIYLHGERIGTIYIRSDLERLFSRLRLYVLVLALVIMGSLALTSLVASKLRKTIMQPHVHLMDLTRTVAENKDYSLRAVVHSKDELGVLAEAFNEMLEQIQQRDAELTMHRNHLEEEVRKRTGEVARTNVKLQQELGERRRAEESLKEGQRFLENIFSSIQDGLTVLDDELNIIAVNPTIEGWYPHAAPMVGRKCHEAFHGKQEPCPSCPASITIRTGKASSGLLPKYGPGEDGQGWLDVYAFPLVDPASSSVKGVIEYVRDVSSQKHAEEEKRSLEEQLRHSQKMEAVGQFAGGIAHDFNNLLTVIKGYSQLSLLELREHDRLKPYIEGIEKASDRAGDLVRQILAFSRRQIMEMKVVDVNNLIRNLEKMLHRIIGEDIELSSILANYPCSVKADAGQIEQVILNLAANAKDAMPSGGKLTIESKRVDLDEEYARRHVAVTPGRYVMIAVSDTGIGLPREVMEKVFEPFFTTKEKGKGTGLGLSTAYGIVKQSGGSIWVYSEPGQGTTFKIYLPLVDEAPDKPSGLEAKEGILLGNETILVVEDERKVREVTVEILTRLGYTVLEASNGLEALEACEREKGRIDLLFTDVVMPLMGGKELADKLKVLVPQVKVLFTSGYTDDAIVHHGALDPGLDFIQKPFNPSALAKKVREVLDRTNR